MKPAVSPPGDARPDPRPQRLAGSRTGKPAGQVVRHADSVADLIKPRLRGWLHTGTFPLSVLLGTLLVIFAPAGRGRESAAVFAFTAALLFAVSALYHRGRWSPRTCALLKRLDHANIFLIIAGTYTPFSVLLLPPSSARVLLWIVWSGAAIGVVFRAGWVNAPRWLYVPLYVALGWVALAYLPQLLAGGGTLIFVLLILGGAFYTAGALVYGLRRPDPSPTWFGFHEIFHALTVLAFLAHYTGVWLAERTT